MKSAVCIDVFRERQEPSILDLILTNEGGMISNLCYEHGSQ